jgi:hypothetical protein
MTGRKADAVVAVLMNQKLNKIILKSNLHVKQGYKLMQNLKPKLSDFLLDLRRSLAHKGFAKILDISTGMPAVFANPYASRYQHISSQKIAQLRFNCSNIFFYKERNM